MRRAAGFTGSRGETAMMRYSALDGLRGTAAFIVVISHFTNRTGFLGGAAGFGAGQLGVMLFFLISGFLMGRLYVELPFTWANVGEFAKKRVARVVPLFFFVVLASAAAFAVLGKSSRLYRIDAGNLFPHLLTLDGVSVLWTIPVEIHFYLVFPLFWLCFARLGRVATVAVLVAIAVAGLTILNAPGRSLLYHIHYFATGVIVSLLIPRRPLRGGYPLDALFIASCLAVVAIMPNVATQLFGGHLGPIWKSWIALAVLTTVLASSLLSGLATAVLGSRPFAFLGDISYSVYLLHLPLLTTLDRLHIRNTWLFLAVFIGLLIPLAYLSYRLIEVPARRAINRLRIPVARMPSNAVPPADGS